jgi:chemotaxis protein CheZ
LLLVLEYLSRHIKTTRDEIGALRPEGRSLSAAADELEEIVAETARAANEIMSAAEAVESIAPHTAPDIAAALTAAATRIYEASAFQDITGQRITKALRALQEIEGKIDALARACDSLAGSGETAAAGDAALLNGPQLGRSAFTQSDIDKLFESFGSTP